MTKKKTHTRDAGADMSDDISDKRWDRKIIINFLQYTTSSGDTINLAFKEGRSIYRQYAMQDIRDAAQNAEEKKQLLQNEKAEYLQIIRDAERRQKMCNWSLRIFDKFLFFFIISIICVIVVSSIMFGAISVTIATAPIIETILYITFFAIFLPAFRGCLLFAAQYIEDMGIENEYAIAISREMIKDIDAELAQDEQLTKANKLPNSHEIQPDNSNDLNPQVESENRDSIPTESGDKYNDEVNTPNSSLTLALDDGNKEKGGSVTALLKDVESSQTP